MSADIEVKDNTKKALELIAHAKKTGLESVGANVATYAATSSIMPVVTGRAKNSITWVMKGEKEGTNFTYFDDKGEKFDYDIGTGAEEDSVYVGSNVKYFPLIENGGVGRAGKHVLRNAVSNHKEEIKNTLAAAFKEANLT